jgi:beta-aspartyl-peptidase (threonine type)
VLDHGGSALDAVEAVLNILEDDPLFNAGRGAVFTSEGKNELDASIMDGSNLKAGAVAGVTRTRHPISLARAVMEKSPYVMMAGPGADAFGARSRPGAGRPQFLFHRGALAVAGQAVDQGRQARSAASRRRAASGPAVPVAL